MTEEVQKEEIPDNARIAVVIGTRAQLIKTAPVMRRLEDAGIAYRYIYTAQHRETIDDIRRDFGIKAPDYVLFDWQDEAKSIGRFGGWMLLAFVRLVTSRRTILPWKGGIVITHGDTASTFWGALLGRVTGNRVMHLESGLRSFNLLQPFPEEILRLLTFRLANVYVCPDRTAMDNLARYHGVKINTHCNTLFDAVTAALASPDSEELPASVDGRYAIASIHRFENIFKRPRFEKILQTLEEAAERVPLVFVLHPATQRQLERWDLYDRLDGNPRIEMCKRLSFFAFQKLLAGSEFVVTDGGSNQEELFYLGKPTLILRDVTERIEGLKANAVLASLDEVKIREFVADYESFKRPPFSTDSSPSAAVVEWLIENGYGSKSIENELSEVVR